MMRDDDIPQLLWSWDNNITDLVSGIPLKLPPIQEVNHEINLIDPEKRIHYCLPKCPEHFREELSQKIERYTTAQWWIPAVAHQAVPMLCILKKNGKLCTVFDLREQNDNTVKDMTPFLSGDDLFSAPKTSQSLSNSDLGHLRHSSDSDRLRVPETLWSTSYSDPHPAVPNAPAHSSHSDPSTDIASDGHSETSASSKGNPETSSESALSDLKSTPMFFGNSLSRSRDRAAPVASDIKGRVIKVIRDVKGQWWSGSMGNVRRWP